MFVNFIFFGSEICREGLCATHVLKDCHPKVVFFCISLAHSLKDNLAEVREVYESFPGNFIGDINNFLFIGIETKHAHGLGRELGKYELMTPFGDHKA